MKDRSFSAVFSILFEVAKDTLFISSRETFYRLLFQNVYQLVDNDMYSDDTLRRVTSGTQPIPGKILKLNHTKRLMINYTLIPQNST